MSRINELIKALCPKGVPHALLSEVAGYSNTRIDSNMVNETSFVGVDNLVADKGGRVDSSYVPNTGRLTAFQSGDVLLGNIRPYLKKVWLATSDGGCSGDVLAIRVNEDFSETLSPEYLYYVLSSDTFFAYSMQHAKGTKMPRGSKPAILNFRLPIPPSEVQSEIVRILDQFTELDAELDAELEARSKQYKHYRNELLTFPEDGVVRWVPMGELFRIVATPKGVPRGKYKPSGELPIVDQGQELVAGYTDDLSKRVSLDKCIVFGDHTRAIKWIDFEFATGADGTKVLVANDGVALRYAYFTLLNAEIPDRGYNRHWSVTREIMVAIPSLTTQKHIVQVLDQFDALVNDISIGLPAETKARRKQYEYYRDKLLTFPEAAA